MLCMQDAVYMFYNVDYSINGNHNVFLKFQLQKFWKYW